MATPKSSNQESNNRYLNKELTNDRMVVEFPIVNGTNEDRKDEVDDRINKDDHSVDRNEDQAPDLQITTKRERGRLRKIMTGLREKPKKQYQVTGNYTEETEFAVNDEAEEFEFSYLAEVPISKSLKGPEAAEWIDAMIVEMKAIIRNDTWRSVDRPKEREVIGSHIVLRNKLN